MIQEELLFSFLTSDIEKYHFSQAIAVTI